MRNIQSGMDSVIGNVSVQIMLYHMIPGPERNMVPCRHWPKTHILPTLLDRNEGLWCRYKFDILFVHVSIHLKKDVNAGNEFSIAYIFRTYSDGYVAVYGCLW